MNPPVLHPPGEKCRLHEPAAIVGIGCRYPGAGDVESFWRILRDGVETVGDYPGGRFAHLDSVYSADRATGESIASRRGGFLSGLDRFDAGFFGISPREAALLDPQQRLLLEVAWEAIEDAGIPTGKLAGTRTGVYVGMWTSDYESCVYERSHDLDFYATTGGGRYPASGRLAYFFDLRGPNLTVDTACSSSLVAVHLACQSLRSGESEIALAGGVNVILRPEITLAYSAAQMLSPDGRCKFGDASANGYVRSEGAGVVALKPLSRALADRDRIYALIRGSAVNNDGRSSGLLISPSREGQEAMLRSALRDAGVTADDIDYIEAHGTGTAAGDPVEIETIGRVMATGTRPRPCAIGSLKTNFGHTESAAGVAGLIKTALSLQRGVLPASLHLEQPNPAIAWNRIPVVVQTRTTQWPHGSERRIAGVSGFGITGTNAHVVLESAGPAHADSLPDRSNLYLLSAHTPEALRATAISWRELLSGDPNWPVSMGDLAFTAATRRTHLDFRLAVTASDRTELESRLSAWIGGEPGPGVALGTQLPAARRIAFVFPGQGGQWVGMGRSLLRDEPVFREALEKCDLAVRQHAGWSVIGRLLSAEHEGDFSEIDVVQPALFAVMVALAALWRSWGVEPDAVAGHSMGESAAAAVSGALTLDDASAVICHRSRLMKQASGQGRMAVTGLSFEEATLLAEKSNGRISVAANNSPTSTVISGDADAVEQCLAELESREVFCRRIKVDVASHSAHMEPFREELARLLKGIQPRDAAIPLYSTTTGTIESGAGLNADYWARNLRFPVLFSTAVQRLLADGFGAFLEINAHPVLLHAIEEGGRDADKVIVAAGSLRRDQSERAALLDAAGTLFVNGFPLNWDRLYPRGTCLRLPPYRFQRERHWIETEQIPARRAAVSAKTLLDHIYELRWTPGGPLVHQPAARSWWLICGEGDLADQIGARMEALGDSCIRVANAGAAQQALESFGALCRGVVYVPAIGTEPREVMLDTYQTVSLVRALAALGTPEPPRLWLLTSGAFQLPGDGLERSLAGSPAWGLSRVIAREYPEMRCVNVDLGGAPSIEDLETFVRLLQQNGPEEQIAVRGRDYFVARYEPHTAVKSVELPTFRADATYLITGGMGGIGLELARWLAVQGARYIALLGRSAPSHTARERIAAIEALGASVRVFQTDVSEESQVASALRAIAAEMPQLRGVFHLSVVTEGALLTDLTEESLRRVMLPKAAGAWNLNRHLERVELDFFVLFSSIAAAYSQPGFGSYAAANAFLDSLARWRRAKGLPALSIQWCPWTAVGLANEERAQRGVKLYRDQAVTQISAEAALDALGRMMLLDAACLLVMPARWDEFARSFESARGGSNGVPRAFLGLVPATPVETVVRAEESIREKLASAPVGRPRRALLETHLQETAARVIKTSANRVDPTKPLGSMGVDSLMALELVRRLSATTGVRLPATAVFNYPTVVLLGEEIARRMGIPLDGEAAAAIPTGRARTANPANVAAEISDEEAIAALTGQNRNAE